MARRTGAIACLCLLALFAGAQAQSYKNFADALGQSQFSKLRGIVNNLGLTKTFSNPDLKLTVFVPTDAAFNSALSRYANNPLVNMDTLMQQRSLVQQVVYYHIVKEVVKAPLPQKSFPTMVTGRNLEGDGMTVKGVGSSAKIIKPNVPCGQGLAHEIDNVLLFVNVAGLLGR